MFQVEGHVYVYLQKPVSLAKPIFNLQSHTD